MDENSSIAPVGEKIFGLHPPTFKTIMFGGLTVGVLDCLAANLRALVKGNSLLIVWQYVASGLLGKGSYKYGWMSFVLGLLIHFFIAFSVTTIYYLAHRRLLILVRQPIPFGVLYGITVYFVMGYIVSPLSAVAKLPFSLSSMLIGIFIHIICVGLPIALLTRHFMANDR